MERILCLLSLLIPGILAGCSHFQTSGQIEQSPPSTVPTNIIQKEVKSLEPVLFKGDNMTVLESSQGDLRQVQFDRGKKSCLDKTDENVKRKLRILGYEGATKFFEFDATQTYNSGPDKFTLKINKDLFSRIDSNFLKKLDQYVGFTITRNLYFLENDDTRYLLLIGTESATSGMGHNYRTHLLVPLDPNRSAIDFQSISDNPRRIGIAESGEIYYTQIDPPYFGAIREVEKEPIRLTASVFIIDSAGNKRLGAKFDFKCGDLGKIFDDKNT
ncbi:MAG: hypothetical protein WBD22_12420 [Pyrinomonadaceae bacterium]